MVDGMTPAQVVGGSVRPPVPGNKESQCLNIDDIRSAIMNSLQQIAAFTDTARHGSFAAAARETGSAPSTLAKAVGRLEQRLGGREGLHAVAGRPQEPVEASPDGRVIVDHEHVPVAIAHALSTTIGSVKKNVAPRVALLVAQIWPPCFSMIERAIASPIPMPPGLVV